MGIAEELEPKLANNDHFVYITDADDLLAAWRHRRENKFKRSFDFTSVPTEYRLSAPPSEKAPCMPCHVTIRRKLSQVTRTIQPAPELSTIDCHGHGRIKHISLTDLDELESIAFAKRNVAPYVSPVLDSATLALVCKDLGINGRAMPKVINGRQYIAFSGHPGLRTRFPGTLYSARNQKIITMAIGSFGANRMIRNGGFITIGLTCSLTVLECYLNDQFTLSVVAGNLASDITKIGIAALMAKIATVIVGGFTTAACAPIVAIIGVSIFVGAALNWVDDRYGLTEKLVAALEEMGKEVTNMAYDAETKLYRATDGFFRSQGLTIPRF